MNEQFTFEEGMQELEQLVQTLESGQMSLEDSFKAYERAAKLRDRLNAILDESDRRIQVLTEAGEQPLDAGEAL
ncbi:MAG: exodeoxyribonuclease VII small subunit [Clostridia bacterium]|nr:exodeoxyribonuclease VII small subunit [Clostridia bacterium]